MVGPCFSVMLKFFSTNWTDDRQIAVSPKPCDFGLGMAKAQVPTVTSFGPMGIIHPSHAFQYGVLRRANRLSIWSFLPRTPFVRFVDGKHQKSPLKRLSF